MPVGSSLLRRCAHLLDRVAELATPWRLRVYPAALVGAVLVAWCLFVATAAGASSPWGRVGGDLPAFLAAARIVDTGDVAHLYDLGAQRAAQAPYLPDGTPGFLPFAYPPFVAAAYIPLTRLPYTAAYVVHTLVMLAAAGLGGALLARRLGVPVELRGAAVALVVLFEPMFRAIFGGQNTPLSLLCVAAAMHARGAILSGAWLGTWLFKPQLALPVLVAAAWRRPAVLVGAVPVAALAWLAGAAVAGPGWIPWWIEAGARPFVSVDRDLNPHLSASLMDVGGPLALIGGAAVAVGTCIRRPESRIPIVATAAPLVSVHALFYDTGLAMVALLAALGAGGGATLVPVLAVWAVGFLGTWDGRWTILVSGLAFYLAFVSAPAATRRSTTA